MSPNGTRSALFALRYRRKLRNVVKMMRLMTAFLVDIRPNTPRIGCTCPPIASSSLATEWIKGKTIDEAEKIRNTEIVEELSLPPVKIHCSVLAEDAIKAAINDFKQKNES